MTTWTRARASSWRRLAASTWRRPHDPSAYGWLDIDVSRALSYLDELNASSNVKVTLTHLVGKALATAIASCPEVNGVLRRGQLHLRDSVDVFFQVAYEHGGNLSGAKIARVHAKSVREIAAELAQVASAIRAHAPHELARSDARLSRLPAALRTLTLRAVETAVYDWGLDLSRFGVPQDGFGSAMVTNVGVFGLPHGLAPLLPFTRVPILLTIGAVHDAALVEAGQVVVRPVLPVGVTLDHRVLDGAQAGTLAKHFQAAMADPSALSSG
jgi:pyruvate/2-oxoglutarate dehydrogenase complex dihydrolipoamide acyltransferase (E2) component